MVEKMGFEKNRRVIRSYGNKPVRAIVGGKKHYFRSKLEYHWAQYLEILKQSGEIADWEFEPEVFYFKDVKTAPVQYRPDFKVTNNDGSHYWQETKGWHDGKTNKKLQRMSKHYPDEVFELVLQRIPKKGVKGANRRSVAARYTRRIIDASEILKKAKGMIKDS